jgi:hypothetical protein
MWAPCDNLNPHRKLEARIKVVEDICSILSLIEIKESDLYNVYKYSVRNLDKNIKKRKVRWIFYGKKKEKGKDLLLL